MTNTVSSTTKNFTVRLEPKYARKLDLLRDHFNSDSFTKWSYNDVIAMAISLSCDTFKLE